MRRTLLRFGRLIWDRRGVVAVEVALVAPSLLAMSIGSFEVSRMVARQTELQAASAEASSIALASEPTSASRRATVKSIIAASTGLNEDKVTVDAAYRCGSATTYVTDITTCGTNRVSSYVKIVLEDSYNPFWRNFGIGYSINFNVTRYVMIKQQTSADEEV